MSTEENKAIVRRLLEDGFNGGDDKVIDELVAPTYMSREDDSMRVLGIEGFKEIIAMFRTAFPDGRLGIEDIIAEGDKVVTWAYFTGTHRGPLEGIAPTGRRVKVKDVDLYRLELREEYPHFTANGGPSSSMSKARHQTGSSGGSPWFFAASRKNASIFPAGVKVITIRPGPSSTWAQT